MKKLYPPLYASGGRRRNETYLEFSSGLPSGFIKSVLKEKIETGGANLIELDKFVEVWSNNQVVAKFTDIFTKPVSEHLIVIDMGLKYLVSLKEPPKYLVQQNELTFKKEADGLVYNQYKSNFLPHCYPQNIVQASNVFRKPEMANGDLLQNLVGMTSNSSY